MRFLICLILTLIASYAGASFCCAQTVADQMFAANNRLVAGRTLDPSLCAAAQRYADFLADTHQQGHYADHDPETRARAAGFTGTLRAPVKHLGGGVKSYAIGEVLAFGHSSVDQAFAGWLKSTGHREALLEATFDVCGFAKANDAPIYVGMFGNSKAQNKAAVTVQQSQPTVAAPKITVAPAACSTPATTTAIAGAPVRGAAVRGIREVGRGVRAVGRRLWRPFNGRLRGC